MATGYFRKHNKSLFLRLLKLVGWLVAALLSLFILLAVLLQNPVIQNYVKDKIVQTVNKKANTQLQIKHIGIAFPGDVLVDGVFIPDQQRDTILYAGRLRVRANLLALIQHRVSVRLISLQNSTVKLEKRADGSFNFSYIINALNKNNAATADTVIPAQGSKQGKALTFKINDLSLTGIHFSYHDLLDSLEMSYRIGDIKLTVDHFDPENSIYKLNKISLSNSSGYFHSFKMSPAPQTNDTVKLPEIAVNQLSVDSSSFIYSDNLSELGFTVKVGKLYIQPQNIDLNKNTVDVKNLFLTGSSFVLKDTAVTSGSIVNDSTVSFDWKIKLDKAFIQDNSFKMYSLDKPADKIKLISISRTGAIIDKFEINNKLISGEIRGVTAVINDKYDLKRLDVSLEAGPTHAKIRDLLLQAGNSELKASLDMEYPNGPVMDIASPDRLKQATISLQIPGCVISKEDITRWFSNDSVFDNLKLPDRIKLTGYASGSTGSLSGNVAVTSIDGTINTSFTAGNLTGNMPYYSIQTDIPGMKAGKILNLSAFTGDLSMYLSVTGKGKSLENLAGSFNANIRNVEYNEYAYKNITLSGSLADSLLKAKLVSVDSNATVDITVSAGLGKKVPVASVVAAIHSLNMQKLKLSNQLIAFSGLLKADITGKSLDSISAAVTMSKLKIYHADTLIIPDSISLALTSGENQSALQFHSGFMDLKYNGTGNLSDLPAEMKNYFSKYLLSGQSVQDTAGFNTSFYFDAQIKKIDLLREFFVPGLEKFNVKLLRGRYDHESGKFDFSLKTGNVVYDNYELDSLVFGITTDTTDIRYNMSISNVQSADIDIPTFLAEGKLNGARLYSSMQILDRSEEPRFNLDWTLSLGDTVHELSFTPDSLIINYDRWKVNDNNGVVFYKAGIYFRDMILSYGHSSISLLSDLTATNDTVLDIQLDSIDLGYISQVISRDSSLITGTLSGKAKIQHIFSVPVFSGNIQAGQLGYKGEVLGDLSVEANNKHTRDKYELNGTLVNQSSRVSLKGNIAGDSAKAVDMTLKIDSFQLHTVQPFLETYLTELKGILNGNLHITGTLGTPRPTGTIKIENTDFILAGYNTHLSIAENKIDIDNKGIHLNTFSLTDSRGNKATISGSVLTSDYKDFRFNINVSASNLLVLNNPEATDQQYYGKLNLNTDIRIRGTDKKPVINASLTALKGTDLTYSLVSHGGYVSDEGIVKFVSFAADSSRFSSVEKTISVTDSIQNRLMGMEVSANIEIQKGSKFTIIMNPTLNDRLDITAGAVLSFSMASSGIMNLTGKATIESGTYHMSLTRVQKKFDIQQGSSITWTGNPSEPQLNITAVYSIRTAPIGLFSAGELPSDQQAKQPYRKQLPFRVELNMTGNLTDPNLKFSINMPRQYEGVLNGAVAAKLDQLSLNESEVNKQAVSLLLFGNFLSQTDQLAMLSLSNVDYANKILSEALNKTAERYIKFIDLNFQLQSYNDYGQSTFTRTRTDLSVKASKELFNDRLRVNAGSVFVLESDQKKQSVNTLNNIAPEANLAYKLTPDGSLSIRAFNQNEYTGLLDGLVRETGVSIVYVKNFNEFIELFNKGKLKQ